jgi:phospholipid transport system substrate-binding protein
MENIKRAWMSVLTVLWLALMAPIAAAQTASPTETVKSVVDGILAILRDDSLSFEEARPRIRSEIQRGFDDVAMAQSVLSTNWRSATEAQQDEFRQLLMRTIESTYIGRVRAYTNESVEFRGETVNGNRASVNSVIISNSGNIPIVYQLRQRRDGWFVYDVEIENVSMVSTYRETYRSVVRRDGMDGLLQQMRDKLLELEAREGV